MGKRGWAAGIAGAALGGAAWFGLKVPPAPFPPPDDAGRDLDAVDLPDGLPDPVLRYYRAVALFPRVTSVYASGRGRRRIVAGRLPAWAPVRWRLYLEPGGQFRREIDFAWLGQPVIRRRDEIIDGAAKTVVGGQTLTGDAVHRAGHTTLWVYTLAFCPTALLTLPGVEWEPVDGATARLHIPQIDSHAPPFTLFFDPASSALTRVYTGRFHERSGRYYPYQVTFGPRRSLGGTSLTNQVGAAWGGDFYMHMDVEDVRRNVALPFPTINDVG
ncbi:MAG: hypothetical protein JXB47_04345 [Anaerolineae bacterium]|nr:hypothetical protein [Anaerolineae bacterium]